MNSSCLKRFTKQIILFLRIKNKYFFLFITKLPVHKSPTLRQLYLIHCNLFTYMMSLELIV